ncbi:CPBP family intramembrane metalloprotease [Clostridium swellfunianum]|uniref:CPBP family intramembrane glutamic endopeptidase n=1 Tax=Clostridium swellfunianum TaxID=1367462 RepID=UPI00202F3DFD|nr:CPBP family intramembrane glutamic endopeptidase [Clostridium swellfunianum]MCM0650026.1 CPBP family intramembrane metalloprotease [Clostridium swellfunianum]
MKKLQENKPIWHAVIWILMYILVVNIGDNISGSLGQANLPTVVLLIAFSIVLLIYLKKNNWFELYGFRKIGKAELTKALFFVPILATVFLHYLRGINKELGFKGFILAIALMLCVGFIEEVVFRGFLYQGILKESGMRRAVLISGITFAIGHIVNLLRGYTTADQINQVVIGIFIGITLALIVALTKSILPCILYHILFNISGTITYSNLKLETYMVVITSVVCVLYSVYMLKVFNLKKDSQKNMTV